MKFILLLFCLFFVGLLFIINISFDSFDDLNVGEKEIIDFNRTHTRALCSGQTCRDFLVSCSDRDVVELKPISGFVTFSENWKDLREKKELC